MRVIIVDAEIYGQLSKLESDLWNKIEFLNRYQGSDNPKFKRHIEEHITPQKMWEIVQKMRQIYSNPDYVRGTINL